MKEYKKNVKKIINFIFTNTFIKQIFIIYNIDDNILF